MEKIVAVKSSDNLFASHIYEHMFVFQLVRFFHSNNLLAYLDYTVDARNYHKGFVWVEVCLFSDAALQLKEQVLRFRPIINEEEVNLVLLQVMAETGSVITGVDYGTLFELLNDLTAKNWVDASSNTLESNDHYLETSSVIDSKKVTRARAYFEQKISISQCAVSQPKLIVPLAIVLAKIIEETLRDRVCSEVPCYSVDDSIIEIGSTLLMVNKYVYNKQYIPSLDGLTNIFNTIVTELTKEDTVGRLRQIARQNDNIVPSMHAILEYSGYFIGASYWENEVTIEYVTVALELISVDFNTVRA